MFKRLFLLIIFIASLKTQAQQWKTGAYHHPWSDSLLETMSLREMIGQTMMVAAWSNKDELHTVEIENLISKYHIGGICFFQGSPLKQAYLTNYYQQMSSVPMLIGIDGEWGLAMRLQGVQKLPFQMTLSASGNEALAYQSGNLMGQQCRRMGIHVNFAPDVDVNTNPANPIIGFRSFGESAADVTRLGSAVMHGMQDAGIMACAKHFPGHGDSKADSHQDLPLIEHDKTRLEEVELMPFRELFGQGVMSAMVGHLEVPSLDSSRHRPSSLSRPIVTALLKEEMGFKGLVFTDALNMKGVTRYYGSGYAEAGAMMAGNDILLYPNNVAQAVEVIEAEIRAGRIDSLELREKVRKILYFKVLANLHHYSPIDTRNLMQDLGALDISRVVEKTAEACVTIASDKNHWLPFDRKIKPKVALWTIGKELPQALCDEIAQYQDCDVFFTHRDSGYAAFGAMSDSLSRHYSEVIISIHDQNLWGKKSQFIPQEIVQNIYYVTDRVPSAVLIFGNVYLLKNLPNLPCAIMAYENGEAYQRAAAKVLFGASPALGHLPATAWEGYTLHQGLRTDDHLFRYEIKKPREAGFSEDFRGPLMALLQQAQTMGAAPGGQVLILKNGYQILDTTWGSFYYDSVRPVTKLDMYDVASITKVAATTLSIMRLYETGKIRLDAHIHEYLPELKGTNKEKLTLRQILLHEAGLQSWIPFYKEAMLDSTAFQRVSDSLHPIQVSDSCWMNADWTEKLWRTVLTSPIDKKGSYRYSDLGMIIAARIIEKVSGMNVASYADKYFYAPMQLRRTLFNPAVYYENSEIAPTVNDNYFRMQQIQGYVHDPAAAMLGGISGNAGLFTNATELGVIFQMLLQGGEYKGIRYLRSSTIHEFTQAGHKKTHRGLGFDKPNGLAGAQANISGMVPMSVFGHTGFTGNWAWADPKNQLVFIFLSNRTYPDENNKKLSEQNIRTQAIELVYKALE